MKNWLLVIFNFLILAFSPAKAQSSKNLDSEYYRSPMDIPLLLSGNFAEARTNHFHSGIDIKTEGVEGKPLYSVADGYIVRIGVSPTGYGRVIYINHPNGTTSVYGHMQKFTPELEKYINSERLRLKKNILDIYPEAHKFPLRKGDLIGYSGNSGSSAGPHLHFEIRETASQRPLNVAKQKVYNLRDDIYPTIVRLHYIETDTIQGVPVHSKPRSIDVKSISPGEYELADTSVLELGRNGYFVLEATDRKNNTQNTMGIYSARLSFDGKQIFAFYLDSFLFSEQRYVNSLTHYAMQKGSRNELLTLAIQTNNKLSAYKGVKNMGAINLQDYDTHSILIEAEDDNDNVSRLAFTVKKRSEDSQINYESDGIPLDCRKDFTKSEGGITVKIPAGALYESIFYNQSVTDPLDSEITGNIEAYSPVYNIHTTEIPLHSAITISIDVLAPPQVSYEKLCISTVSEDGKKYSYAGGKYENGSVTATIRTFGRYTIVADTIPPTISPSFSNGADLSKANTFTVTVRDNFSGVSSYSAEIDGKWIPFEQKGNVITHRFDPSYINYNGNTHNLVITAKDNKGNSRTVKRTFIK